MGRPVFIPTTSQAARAFHYNDFNMIKVAFRILFLLILSALALTGCSDDPSPRNPLDSLDALEKIVAERYCYLGEKEIDWHGACAEARSLLDPDTDPLTTFTVMSNLLDTLRDGHVNLSAPFATSYYKKWWSDYPQDFDDRCLQEYYLHFGGLQSGSIQYAVFLPDTIGYIRYPSFSSPVGESQLDYILALLGDTKGLVIDIRDNGGGLLTNVPAFVGRFIDREFLAGYIRHKTGPGADDFSDPYPVKDSPASGRVQYFKPIAVLTNRSCFSAANDFVSVMKQLPQVKIVGARTGGGGGLPFTSELPNGWAIRFSASPMYDAAMQSTEAGIDPSEGCEVHSPATELAEGRDAILDFALDMLGKGIEKIK